MKSRFKVHSTNLDGARSATVEIDRGAGVVTVRPYRRRRTYTLPLADVAAMIVWRIARAEAAEKRAAKRRKA